MSPLHIIDSGALSRLSELASSSLRRRRNLNLHPTLADPVQRLFNAMEPGTYVRPHRHARPEGWELMLAVRGAFSLLVFSDCGEVLERVDLDVERGPCAVEIPALAWHALVVLKPGTCMFEVKPGPYSPVTDKDFAAWAPAEGEEPKASALVAWFARAQIGERAPSLARTDRRGVPASRD